MLAFARRKYAEMEYGYPSVVTPGVFKARSIPCSFTTIPMISGRSTPGGSPARNDFITSSLSAIWRTSFGETKLTASICLKPTAVSFRRYSTFNSVGMTSASPCHASRGHSTIFTISDKWRDRKSTRLNSSHGYISYAVFCLKKKKNNPKELCFKKKKRRMNESKK